MSENIDKKKLYVGCALTHAPEMFKNSVEVLKERLEDEWEVMRFLGTTAGTAADVYRKDIIENVGGCDAFLAVVDLPSIGLGWEMSEAKNLKKPSLYVAHASTTVTRLALGAVELFPDLLNTASYEDMITEVPQLARTVFADVLSR